MVQYSSGRLDASFAALSDATRRGVLEQLGRADASITDLAQTFHMTLTGMRKHVGVLEQAELVTTEKVGRVRTCRLGPRRLEEETAWIERHRQLWDARFDELDKVVEELKRKEKVDGRNEERVRLPPWRTVRRWSGSPSVSSSSRERSTARRASCSRRGPSPSCSGSGGCRSRWECPCFPAKWMFVSGAGTVWSSHIGDSQAAFFGTYNEVTPHSRLVWTNEESDEGSVTTVTFAEKGGKTLLAMHELYPSKEALDAAGTGAADAMGESFEQLDELLVTLGASEGRS